MTFQTLQEVCFSETNPAAPFGETSADGASAPLALLLDELAHGVLVISAEARILHTNLAARREIDQAVLLKASAGELQLVSPANNRTFKKAVGQAAEGSRSLVKLSAGGMVCTLALVPLDRQAGARCQRIAVFLSRSGVCESGVFADFARSHGLTRTEARVLVFLCSCLSTPQIADQMNVAVSTVRSHVRSLCDKTACRGVRELVNQVAILPPLRPLPSDSISNSIRE
jgi:DNA-binding CsgD family transcriptional regulator